MYHRNRELSLTGFIVLLPFMDIFLFSAEIIVYIYIFKIPFKATIKATPGTPIIPIIKAVIGFNAM